MNALRPLGPTGDQGGADADAPTPDDEWGVGCYEDTAAELAPVAERLARELRLDAGDAVLDVACGTGNGALAARVAGARVAGLDASPRLVGVARERVRDGEFVVGNATRLPFADASFDVAISIFGVIFASPAEDAAAELARVVRPGGRVAVTTWTPRGPLRGAVTAMRSALDRVSPRAPAAPPGWGDAAGLERLLGRYGELEVREHLLDQPPIAPEELWDRWERLHPMWIRARAVLEPAGAWDGVREASIAALHDAGIADGAASPYLLAILARD